jgi:pimeloyl-ACP methyl ester carboxylesterase
MSSWTVLHQIDASTEQYRAAWETYHTSLARLLTTAREGGRFISGQGLNIQTSGRTAVVPLSLHSCVWRTEDVGALYPVGEYRTKALSRVYRYGSWGVPVVVERRRPPVLYPEEEFLTPGTMFAATALLRPSPLGGAVLELFDPLHALPCSAPLGKTLARDISAPFALRLISSPEIQSDWLSFFGVDMPTREGLFFIEPYQRGKIPVVLVHGVLSNPTAWVDLANDLRAVPGFSDHYQLWAFRYSTSAPFLESASRLRRDLYRAVAIVDPASADPALSQIVLIGHSMGGLVCELQAASSQDRLWNAIANRPMGQIVASQEARQALQDMFFFVPQLNVRRVISIGSPHQGSSWAVRPIGRLGAALAQPSVDRAARHELLLESNPGVFSDEVTARAPTSIDMLRPDSALLKAIASLPTSPCVKMHTIFGYGRENLIDGAGDGVVPINSALSPKAASQLGIEASHTTIHRRLETVDEIVRILSEHRAAYVASLAQANSAMPHSNR